MESQRLLKIVSSEDESEVTILLPQDDQDQSIILPGHIQEQQPRHVPLPDSTQHTASLYQTQQQPVGQYHTNKHETSQYQPSVQSYKVSHYQPAQTGHQQTNQNRPVLSSASRGTPTSSVWTSKDYTMWTPKKASGKWLQQDTTLLQDKFYDLPTHEDFEMDQQTVSDSFTKSPIKNPEPVVYPVELTRTSMERENTSNFNNPNLNNILTTKASILGTYRESPTQVPINLSGTLPTNLNIHNNGDKSVPIRPNYFSVSTQSNMNNSVASPVYKSKLEKAVEQKHTGGMAVSGSGDSKHGSGTLKKLLCSDVPDLGAYKMFGNLDFMPNVGTFLEQNETQSKDDDTFLFHTASVNTVNNQTNTKVIPKKKGMLLNKDKTHSFRFKRPYKEEPSFAQSSTTQQSVSNMTLIQGANDTTVDAQSIAIPNSVGQALNELKQQLVVEKSMENPVMDEYDAINMGTYKYTMKGPEGIKSDLPAGICSTADILGDYPAPFLTDMVTELITQKEYVNTDWENKVMLEQWRLREEGHFCDAIFHCNQRQFKFHRIVMSAACPDFLNRYHTNDGETQWMLPEDMIYENVCLFMEYVYLGRILLTVDNVQQIYRLSTMFDLSDLNKYCYDFCRLAKLGHLIISSPYQEIARQVHNAKDLKVPVEKPQVDVSTETTLQISDVGTIDQIADILKKKSHMNPLDPHSTDFDFDWLTSDPDQSNIPIRKRGRTRHKLKAALVNTNKATVTYNSRPSPQKMDFQTHEDQSGTPNKKTQISNDIAVKNKQEFSNYETESEIVEENESGKPSVKTLEDTHEFTNDTGRQLDELPDPLATGKFDETELIKQDKLAKKVKKPSFSMNIPSRKTMVTRYRGQTKTMTILEAASSKKAKFQNSVGETTFKRISKDKTLGKKNLKALKSKLKQNREALKTDEINYSNRYVTMNEPERTMNKFDADEEMNTGISMEDSIHTPKISSQTTSPRSSKSIPAKKRQNIAGDAYSNDKESLDDINIPEGNTSFGDEELTNTPRLRKSTIDQQQESPVKDPVYMRPPKKRTKEISEMMKIEADGPDIERKDSTPDRKKLFTAGELKQKRTPIKFKSLKNYNLHPMVDITQKKLTKSKMLKDGAISQAVYDVEQYGKNIEGEKHYRCCLCNSVFVFSKRAITHIINTHDITIEETVEYIDVEHKKPQSKKCDICGYVTKEINIYYIHFHKYFKHGVPLPKGWQPFRCDLCKKEFFTKFQLREHKLIHFEDNPFVCELCGNGFKSRTGLNSHMFHKHSSVRNHKCPDCIKSFKTKTQMKVHQRVHTGEKPFGCKDPQCNYRSTTRGNMKLHLLNRHKYVTSVVEEYMKDLKSSFSEPSGADIDDPSDLWEIDVDNDEEDVPEGIQVKMENFDVNNAAFESLVGAAAEIANNNRNYLVSSVSNEQDNQPTGQVQSIADQIMVQIVDNQLVTSSTQGNIGGQPETSVKMSSMPTQNLPRHVELLMQNTNTILQPSDISEQDGQTQSMCEYTTDSGQPDLSLSGDTNTHDIRHQAVRSQGNITTSTSQGVMNLGSLSSQQRVKQNSRVPRPSMKQTFRPQGKTPLFKTTIQSAGSEPLFRHVDSNILQAQQSFDGSVNVPASSALREQMMTEEQMIHDFRQVQEHTHFTGDNQNIQRLENSSHDQNMMFTTQQQQQQQQHEPSNQDHFYGLQQAPVSPPAYHLTSQSDLSTQSSLLMSHLQMRQDQTLNQGQGDPVNSPSIQSAQEFNNIVTSQASTGQFNTSEENHLYPGFYQENYQIENY